MWRSCWFSGRATQVRRRELSTFKRPLMEPLKSSDWMIINFDAKLRFIASLSSFRLSFVHLAVCSPIKRSSERIKEKWIVDGWSAAKRSAFDIQFWFCGIHGVDAAAFVDMIFVRVLFVEVIFLNLYLQFFSERRLSVEIIC